MLYFPVLFFYLSKFSSPGVLCHPPSSTTWRRCQDPQANGKHSPLRLARTREYSSRAWEYSSRTWEYSSRTSEYSFRKIFKSRIIIFFKDFGILFRASSIFQRTWKYSLNFNLQFCRPWLLTLSLLIIAIRRGGGVVFIDSSLPLNDSRPLAKTWWHSSTFP